MSITSLGFATTIAILRLAGSTVTQQGDVTVVRSPQNPNHWWGNFLLLPALPQTDQVPTLATQFHENFPGAEHLALGFDGNALPDDQTRAALLAAGLTVESDTVLSTSNVKGPPRPNTEVVCRPLVSDADWAASIALRVACNDRNLPNYEAYCVDSTAQERSLTTTGSAVWMGAFDDDQLVSQMGLADCGDGVARYQWVETHPHARRRGIAATLLSATAQEGVHRWTPETFVIVADPDYHAITLYEQGGFEATGAMVGALKAPN